MEYYFQIRSLITCRLLSYLFICMHVLALRFLFLQYVSCMLTTSLGQTESEWGLKTFSVRVVWNMALRDRKYIYGKLITRNPGSIRKWTPRQSLKKATLWICVLKSSKGAVISYRRGGTGFYVTRWFPGSVVLLMTPPPLSLAVNLLWSSLTYSVSDD